MTSSNRIYLTIFASLLCASASVAQTAPVSNPAQKEQKVAVLEEAKPNPPDARVLDYGAALEAQASPELRRWRQEFVRKKMRKDKIDLAALHAAVDAQYPRASAAARDALVYLLLYTSYKKRLVNLGATQFVAGLPRSDDPSSGGSAPRSASSTGGRAWERTDAGRWIPPDGAPANTSWLFAGNSMSNWLPAGAGANMGAVAAHLPHLRERVDISQRLLSEAYKQSGSTPPEVLREIH